MSRITSTLVRLGYLTRLPSVGQYQLGASVLSVGNTFLEASEFGRAARPLMQQFAARHDVSAGLAVPDRLQMMYVVWCRSPKTLTLRLSAGSMLPMGRTAVGKAYMWALPAAEHPRHLDRVAETYPALKIVAARPGWPWQVETIAVLMHKRNIWYELHGWSPKYHAPELKHDIPRWLKERVLFGGDYPLFTYERLVRDWHTDGYPEEVLDNLFHRNAERFFDSLGLTWT